MATASVTATAMPARVSRDAPSSSASATAACRARVADSGPAASLGTGLVLSHHLRHYPPGGADASPAEVLTRPPRVQNSGMDELRKERLAMNEALFRNVNEGMRAGHADSGTSLGDPLRVRRAGLQPHARDRRLPSTRRSARNPRRFVLLHGARRPRCGANRRAPRWFRRSSRGGGVGRHRRGHRPAHPRLGLALGERQLGAEGHEGRPKVRRIHVRTCGRLRRAFEPPRRRRRRRRRRRTSRP